MDGLADVTKYKMTETAKRELLAEMKINETEEKLANMLDVSRLPKKQLFFPKDIQRQVEELGSFLQPENYQKMLWLCLPVLWFAWYWQDRDGISVG